jgi:heterodisulfide reductase subunit C/Ca2+/Na+ antiporter
MQLLQQSVFLLLLITAADFFRRSVNRIRQNILLGRDVDLSDQPSARWKQMALVALGQSKMVRRPVAGFFHILIYAGFVLINIEVLEILIDGIFGTHRVFAVPLGKLYNTAIAFFEWLALGVLIACFVFLYRRFVQKIPRFTMREMKGWPTKDATIILFVEIILMGALLQMNAAEQVLQMRGEMPAHGSFPVSSWFIGWYDGLDSSTLHLLERGFWWFHFVGILLFMNYLPFSKHWHIVMAFPNVYYSSLKPKGAFDNMNSVTTEVKLMMDPSASPPEDYVAPSGFGAKDVHDLTWKNLMDAYTCTECGRCSSVCPANITGKLLSPRKVMMDTRDRLEEVGKSIATQKDFEIHNDTKNLHSYISAEELWACTTCNACADACPVNINPVDIIMQMRQYLVMEQSAAPSELNGMFTNLENNGAPWQFNQNDKGAWAKVDA